MGEKGVYKILNHVAIMHKRHNKIKPTFLLFFANLKHDLMSNDSNNSAQEESGEDVSGPVDARGDAGEADQERAKQEPSSRSFVAKIDGHSERGEECRMSRRK